MLIDLLFYLFSSILIASACTVASSSNPIISVLALIVCFFNTASLFILLQAEYLAFILIIVYVGAVAVLFLFVIMMLNIKDDQKENLIKKYKTPWMILFIILIVELVILFWTKNNCCIHDELSIFSMGAIKAPTNIHAIGQLLYTQNFLSFQLSGFVLLVAMIGSIVLVVEKTSSFRQQKPSDQIQRNKKNSLKINKINPIEK